MFSFFLRGGPFMWILLIITGLIIVLATKKAIELFGDKEIDIAQAENGINSIIFWGVFSIAVGYLAHFSGLYSAMSAIVSATEISPEIVTRGYRESIITILAGLYIFIFSAIIWFALKSRFNKLKRNLEIAR